AGDASKAVTWRQLPPGQLLVIREGAVIAERSTGGALETPRKQRLPMRTEPRTYDVVHKTTYRYATPIERSMHVLRLVPVHDRLQDLVAHELAVSVPGQAHD